MATGRTSSSAWDVAAGALIAAEAGAIVTDVQGGPFHVEIGQALIANPSLHRALVAAIAEASVA